MKHPLLLGLPCFALDQVTKWWIVAHLPFESERPVIPGFFDLVHYGNTGAAFSAFRDQNTFFIVLSLATFVGLLIGWMRGAFRQTWTWWGAGLLMGGILGNTLDRFIHRHVVDFLLFDLHFPPANPWPAFNVADSGICAAVGCFLIASLLEARQERRAAG